MSDFDNNVFLGAASYKDINVVETGGTYRKLLRPVDFRMRHKPER
jgi:hypothetical protein